MPAARPRLIDAASLIALETRHVFDAAAGAVAVAAIAEPAPDPTPPPPEPAPPPAHHEVAYVDASLPDVAGLIAGLPPGVEVVTIAAGDGFAAVAADLAGRDGVTAVHLVGHGGPGWLALGGETLDTGSAELADAFRSALAEDADLLVYGCAFGAGEDGRAAVAALAALSGADVAASDDDTGGAPGADGVLERTTGPIEAAALDLSGWSHALGTIADVTRTDGQSVTVNTAPAFNGLGLDRNTIQYGVSGLPFGLSINPFSGFITGTLRTDASEFGGGVYTITVTAADALGNSAQTSFTLTALDLVPQVQTTLPDRTDSEGAVVSIPVTSVFVETPPDIDGLAFSATGLPDGIVVNPATGQLSGTLSSLSGGTHLVTVTATDGGGSSASVSFTWTVSNPPPTGNVPNLTFQDGQSVTLVLAAYLTDTPPDNDTLTYTLADPDALPPGLTFDAGTGRITGTLTTDASAGGPYHLSVTADDGQGGTLTDTFTITVTNVAPRVTTPMPDQQGFEGDTISLDVGSRFADGAPDGDTITVTVTGLPPGLVFDPGTGFVTGTIDRDASLTNGGIYTVTARATDSGGASVTDVFRFEVDNRPPEIVATLPDLSATDGAVVGLDVSGAFVDGGGSGDPLTFAATGLPPGLVLDPATGVVSGTLAAGASLGAPYAVTVTATDPHGGSVSQGFVVDVENVAPVALFALPDRTAADSDAVSWAFAPAFADGAPDADTLVYAATGLPAGLSIDPATGVVSGTIDRSASQVAGGVYTVTVTASDGTADVSDVFTLTVENPMPTAADDAVAMDEDTVLAFDPRLGDADPDGDPIRVTAASVDVGTVTVTGGGTGIRYEPPEHFHGEAVVSYRVEDGEGGFALATVTITVDPVDDDPVLLEPVVPVTVEDGAPLVVETGPHFFEIDGETLVFDATGLPAGLSIDPATGRIEGVVANDQSTVAGGVHVVTVTASDGAGPVAAAVFTITVVNPAPTAVADPGATVMERRTLTLDLVGNDTDPDADALFVDSASAANGTVTIRPDGRVDYRPNDDFVGDDTITYTVSDGQGGTSTVSFTVTVRPMAVIDGDPAAPPPEDPREEPPPPDTGTDTVVLDAANGGADLGGTGSLGAEGGIVLAAVEGAAPLDAIAATDPDDGGFGDGDAASGPPKGLSAATGAPAPDTALAEIDLPLPAGGTALVVAEVKGAGGTLVVTFRDAPGGPLLSGLGLAPVAGETLPHGVFVGRGASVLVDRDLVAAPLRLVLEATTDTGATLVRLVEIDPADGRVTGVDDRADFAPFLFGDQVKRAAGMP